MGKMEQPEIVRRQDQQRANRVWKKMLADYRDPGIDAAQDEAMLEFIARREAVLSDSIDDE